MQTLMSDSPYSSVSSSWKLFLNLPTLCSRFFWLDRPPPAAREAKTPPPPSPCFKSLMLRITRLELSLKLRYAENWTTWLQKKRQLPKEQASLQKKQSDSPKKRQVTALKRNKTPALKRNRHPSKETERKLFNVHSNYWNHNGSCDPNSIKR
jgi:hypothetical protein